MKKRNNSCTFSLHSFRDQHPSLLGILLSLFLITICLGVTTTAKASEGGSSIASATPMSLEKSYSDSITETDDTDMYYLIP